MWHVSALSSGRNRWITFSLLALTVWAGVLRFYGLGHQSLWLDEGVSVLHATAILKHGYPLLANGAISWESFPVHYIMAIGLHLRPDIHVGARCMAALAGTLLVPLFFAFSFQVSRSVSHALIGALLLTFMTYEVAWSRQARLYAFFQCFSLASLICMYNYLRHRRLWVWVTALCVNIR